MLEILTLIYRISYTWLRLEKAFWTFESNRTNYFVKIKLQIHYIHRQSKEFAKKLSMLLTDVCCSWWTRDSY